jgi:hypothetical protein
VTAAAEPLLHLVGAAQWRVALDAGTLVDASWCRGRSRQSKMASAFDQMCVVPQCGHFTEFPVSTDR